MGVAKVVFERDATHVFLMKPLLYDHDCRFFRVVEPIWHDFSEPHIGGPPDGFTLHHHGVVRIIDYEAIAALANTNTANRCSKLPPGLIIGKLYLCELLIGNTEPASPKTLIALRHNHVTTTQIIAFCKMIRIGRTDISIPWAVLRPPFPGGPEHIGHQALGKTRWHVNE